MATFLTSDWHLGDDRFKILGRPFISREQMEDEFVKLHNNLVAPEDDVYVVGDIVCNRFPDYLSHVDRFNGQKVLIRGNHDIIFSDDELLKYFKQVIPDGEGINNDIPCYMVHYPTEGNTERFTLCGHVHSAWKYQLNMFNIGVDSNHFKPTNIEDIPFHFNAISKFYDDDIWCAYNNINTSYRNKRGIKGTYFRNK